MSVVIADPVADRLLVGQLRRIQSVNENDGIAALFPGPVGDQVVGQDSQV